MQTDHDDSRHNTVLKTNGSEQMGRLTKLIELRDCDVSEKWVRNIKRLIKEQETINVHDEMKVENWDINNFRYYTTEPDPLVEAISMMQTDPDLKQIRADEDRYQALLSERKELNEKLMARKRKKKKTPKKPQITTLNGLYANEQNCDRYFKIMGEVDLGNPMDTYELGPQISKGYQGKVYSGKNKITDTSVAIKIYEMLPIKHKYLIDPFHEELGILKMNIHGHIPKFHASYLVGSELWVIMELIKGVSLCRFSEETPNEKYLIAHICKDLLKTLSAFHQNGLLHGDLKPCNVVLAENGDVRLIDLGDCIPVDKKDKQASGSKYYYAPEMKYADADDFDSKVDIWSLGVIILELLRGPTAETMKFFKFFKKKQRKELKNEIDYYIHPYKKNNRNIYKFLRRCLVVNPKNRGTAEELLELQWLQQSNAQNHMAFEIRALMTFMDRIEINCNCKSDSDSESHSNSNRSHSNSNRSRISSRSSHSRSRSSRPHSSHHRSRSRSSST